MRIFRRMQMPCYSLFTSAGSGSLSLDTAAETPSIRGDSICIPRFPLSDIKPVVITLQDCFPSIVTFFESSFKVSYAFAQITPCGALPLAINSMSSASYLILPFAAFKCISPLFARIIIASCCCSRSSPL